MIWGGNAVALRITLNDLPPLQLAAWRASLALAVLLAWTVLRRASIPLPARRLPLVIILGALVTGHVALLSLAAERVPAADVVVLLYLYPIFTALLAHAFLPDERLTARSAVGLLIGFGGAALALAGGGAGLETASAKGAMLAISSAMCWALYTTCTKLALSAIRPLAVVVYPTALSAMGLAWLAYAVEKMPIRAISLPGLLALGYQGILSTAGGSLVWTMLMAKRRASRLSAYTFLAPITGVLASTIVLDERVPGRLAAALVLVVVSLVAIERQEGRDRTAVAGRGRTRTAPASIRGAPHGPA